jgi:hypothetical protein
LDEIFPSDFRHEKLVHLATITENQHACQRLREQLETLHRKDPHAQFHVHIDAAGQYASNLQRFLQSLTLPLLISVGEPKRNKDYHKAFFPKLARVFPELATIVRDLDAAGCSRCLRNTQRPARSPR